METRRWLNQSQPHMLQSATLLLYINAAFALFSLGRNLFAPLLLAGAVAGFGIANEKKWAWYLALVVAIVPLSINVLAIIGVGPYVLGIGFDVIVVLLFQVLLVALLLHPMSRDYQRLWFK